MTKTNFNTTTAQKSNPPKSRPDSLPCLNRINSNGTTPKIDEIISKIQLSEEQKQGSNKLSTAGRKSAFTLAHSIEEMAKKYGINRLGFLTLTFKQNITCPKEAQRRLNSLNTRILKHRYHDTIRVIERCKSGRIHYHLIVVLSEDIRTGFNFEEISQQNYKSANPYLKLEWLFLRHTAKKYGFGRTELLPIKSTAEGIAKYVGKYIAKNMETRKPEDKGVRLVSYSKNARAGSNQFAFVSPGSKQWRINLALFATQIGEYYKIKNLKYEQLSKVLGKRWAYTYRGFIQDYSHSNKIRLYFLLKYNDRNKPRE